MEKRYWASYDPWPSPAHGAFLAIDAPLHVNGARRRVGKSAGPDGQHPVGMAGVGLITKSRHGTSLHYKSRIDAAREIIDYLFLDCCRGRPQLCPTFTPDPVKGSQPMSQRKLNVIFICTGNSARSIMAEAIMRDLDGGRFNAFSAGTQPTGALHPLALATLKRNGHDITNLRSKNLDEFQKDGAPQMDFIFTVCDAAANEECAIWPGRPTSGHWGIPDPAAATGSDAEKALAFARVYRQMRARITACRLSVTVRGCFGDVQTWLR